MKNENIFTVILLFLCVNIFAQNITISGLITTAPGCDEPVPGVVVLLENRITGEQYETITTSDGTYSFDGLPSNQNWVLIPSREATDQCGIDLTDRDDIQRHQLYIAPLASEYARIAADVSANSTISTSDIVIVNQFVDGTIDDFAVNWRFVDADYTLPVPSNPFESVIDYGFPDMIELGNVNQNALGQDFIAIKMGDVNCSYSNGCDMSNPTCETNCRVDNIPSIAICEPRVEGTQVIYPIRYFAPNNTNAETYAAANININILPQNQDPAGCITINEDATLASSPNLSTSGSNAVNYSFLLTSGGIELTNNEVLFELVLDGSANCCFTPTISSANFIYSLTPPPAVTVAANQCETEEFCFPTVTIRGTIETVNGGTEAVENVEIIITDEDGNQYCPGLMTGADGQYTCEVVPGPTYTVRPLKDNKHCLGVTNSDLIKLANHLTGLAPLATPYEQISADVNNDDVLSVFDLLDMQKVILCREEYFPNNTSWRFVDALYIWGNSSIAPVAQDFPEEIVLTPDYLFFNSFYIADFQAMKIGDINGSCPGPSCTSCCGYSEGNAPEGEGREDIVDEEVRQLLEDIEFLANLDIEELSSLESGYLISEVYPNPFEASITLEVFALTQNKGKLRVFDGTGKVVKVEDLQLEKGFHHYELNGLDNLPKGIYYAQLLVDGHTIVSKLIKQ